MGRLLFSFGLVIFTLLFSTPLPVQAEGVLTLDLDTRSFQLSQYLTSKRSPLADYAWDLVQIADTYHLDWRLIPAITGVESSFGLALPANSHNAYGWQNGATKFASWPNSFEVVASNLRTKYLDRGYQTVAEIGRIYAPVSTTWATKVSFFMDQISNYGQTSLPTPLPLYF